MTAREDEHDEALFLAGWWTVRALGGRISSNDAPAFDGEDALGLLTRTRDVWRRT